MPRPTRIDDALTNPHQYRRPQAQHGATQHRVQASDPRRREFAAKAEHDGMLLREGAEEVEAMDFISAAIEWPEP